MTSRLQPLLIAITSLLVVACGEPACGPGAELCDGVCVDTRFDPSHCGGCGSVCGEAMVCSDGVCGAGCGVGTTECDGRCVDVSVDPSNCGGCGAVCADGEMCSAGSCGETCVGGTVECGGACADTDVDPANCGGCGVACELGTVCADGVCALSCSGDLSECSGACVDTDVDRSNCGGCGVTCPDGEVCSAGACATTCGAGTELCDDTCVDRALDPSNCGACGTTCAAEEVCSGGACGDFCGAGTALCGEVCVDTDNDRANCGGCGVACGFGDACVAGSCEPLCDEGEIACDGACVDASSDATHCGTCETACTMSEVCRDSVCDTARAVAVVTTVSHEATRSADAWLIYEEALDRPRQLNPTRFESGTVQSAQLTEHGDAVLFAAQDTEGLYELYVARATTTDLTRLNAELPETVGIQDWSLSPDGTRLVYVTTDPGDGSARVFTVSLDMPGVVSARDETLRATADANAAEVSDDGGVFVRAETDGGEELYFVPAIDTAAVAISPSATNNQVGRFAVSEDGQYVLFEMLEDGTTLDLHVGLRDGTTTALELPEGTEIEGFVVSEGTAALYQVDDTTLVVVSLADPSARTPITASERFDAIEAVQITPAGDRVVFIGENDFGDAAYAVDVTSPDAAVRVSGGERRHRHAAEVVVSGDGSTVISSYESIWPWMTVASTDGAEVSELDVVSSASVYPTGTGAALNEEGSLAFFPLLSDDSYTRELYATPLPSAGWQHVDLGLANEDRDVDSLTVSHSGTAAAFVSDVEAVGTGNLHGFAPGAEDRAVRMSNPILPNTRVIDFAWAPDGNSVAYIAAVEATGEHEVLIAGLDDPEDTLLLDTTVPGSRALEVWLTSSPAGIFFTMESSAGVDLYLFAPGGEATHALSNVVEVQPFFSDEAQLLLVRHIDETSGLTQASVVLPGFGVRALEAPFDAGVLRVVTASDILFLQEDVAPYSIWRVDGDEATRLTGADHDVDAGRPFVVSEDGSRLVYIGDSRIGGRDEVWMVDAAAPETHVQLNEDFGSNSDAFEVQITAAGDYVVFRADANSNRDELFGVDPDFPQTSQVRLHEAMSSTSNDVFSDWVLLDDVVVFRADFQAYRDALYVAALASAGAQTELSHFTDPYSDVDEFAVAGDRVVYIGHDEVDEVFEVPLDASADAVVRSPAVLPSDVDVVRCAGGPATDATNAIGAPEVIFFSP